MVIAERPREGEIATTPRPRIKRVDWGKPIAGLTLEDRMKIGANIRRIRGEKGFSQTDVLGPRCGQARQSRIERGDFRFTIGILDMEASALGVSRDELYVVDPTRVEEKPKKHAPSRVPKNHIELTDEIRARMKSLRTEANLHQDNMLGRHRQTTYSRIERGAIRSASRKDIEQIVSTLGLTSEKLIGKAQEKAEPITIWQAKPPAAPLPEVKKEEPKAIDQQQEVEKKAKPRREDPISKVDARDLRRLKNGMRKVASKVKKNSFLPPLFSVGEGEIPVYFSLGDQFVDSPHFHIRQGRAEFPFDARSAGENYGYDNVLGALKSLLNPRLKK